MEEAGEEVSGEEGEDLTGVAVEASEGVEEEEEAEDLTRDFEGVETHIDY